MAKIPMGNFGNAMPQVQRVQLPQDQSGQMWANTLQGAGQLAGEYAEQQRQKQNEKDNLEAATIASNFGLEIEKLAGDFRQRVAAGEDATIIDREFSAEYAKRLDDTVLKIPESVRESYGPKSTEFGNRQIGSFYDIGRRTESATVKTKLDLVIEQAAKMEDQAAGEEIVVNALKAAGANISGAERIDGLVKFRTDHGSNLLNNIILTATEKSDIAALDAADAELQKKDGVYSVFDGKTTHSFRSTIASRRRAIENQMQQQDTAREASAKSALNDYVADLKTTAPLSPENQKAVLAATKGTPYEQDALLYVGNEERIQQFKNLNTNDQQAWLLDLKSNMQKNPSKDASRDQGLYDIYYAAHKEKLDSAKSDPVAYAASQNQDIKRITGMEVTTNPAQAVKSIFHNDAVLQTMRKKEPGLTIDPISKDDLDGIKQSLERATVPQTIGFISQLVKQAPKNQYGQNLTAKILKQIGDGNEAYLFASQALVSNLNYKGVSVASGILQGQRLIQQKNAIVPQAVEADFRAALGNLSQKGDFKADLDAMNSMYAFYASKKGIVHAKGDEAKNEQAFKDALNAVTGGVYTQQKDGVLWGTKNAGFTLDDNAVESWQVEMPYGMDEEKFKIRLDDSYKRASEISGIPVDFLKSNYRLQLRGDTNLSDATIYDLVNADNKKLTRKDKNGESVAYFLRVFRNK